MITLLEIQNEYVLPAIIVVLIFLLPVVVLVIVAYRAFKASKKAFMELRKREADFNPLPDFDEAEKAISDAEYPFELYFKK